MHLPRTAAASVLIALTLAAGCGSMRDSYDKMIGRDKDKKEDRVDLNKAGRKRLAKLPGLTAADCDRIVANRPYARRRDLVTKAVLTEKQFDRIRDHVFVRSEKN